MIQKQNSTVTIDLTAIKDNILCLKSYIEDNASVMAVIKADAYGHGAVNVAKTLSGVVEAFAVNELAEAVELRQAGIALPVLVFSVPAARTVHHYAKLDITATISAEEHFKHLLPGTSYHLNFDTGMGRLGFHPSEAEAVAGLVKKYRGKLNCTGIYSHFSTADNPNCQRVEYQQKLFTQLSAYFEGELCIHQTNTGGSVFYDTSAVNMVRLGVGIYGYAPGETPIPGLRPALQWDTTVVQVRPKKKGDSISYGARWKMPSEGYIATIPVGYDDGISRRLTGNLTVEVAEKSYPVVGTITMNYCMVFLGEDFYEVGTKVELLRPGYSAKKWAQKLDTIPYEILTGINPRIPRRYVYGTD